MSQSPPHQLGHRWTLVEVRDFISRCYDRDALLTTLINYGREWLTGRLICVVSREHVQPFMAHGWASWGDDAETTAEMATIKVPISRSAVLETIITQGTHTVGTPAQIGFDLLFEETSVLPPEDLMVVPLKLGGKTKMLFVGELQREIDDLMQFSEDIEPLVVVAGDVAHQLEEIIKLSKANKLPPPDERIPTPPARVSSPSQVSESSVSAPMEIEAPAPSEPAELREQPAPAEASPAPEPAPASEEVREAEASQRRLMAAVTDALDASDLSMSAALRQAGGAAPTPPEEAPSAEELASESSVGRAADVAPGHELEVAPRSRRTMPLKLPSGVKETSQLARVSPEQAEAARRRGEGEPEVAPADASSTHVGTPLEAIRQGLATVEGEDEPSQKPPPKQPREPGGAPSRSRRALEGLPAHNPFEDSGEVPGGSNSSARDTIRGEGLGPRPPRHEEGAGEEEGEESGGRDHGSNRGQRAPEQAQGHAHRRLLNGGSAPRPGALREGGARPEPRA